MKLNKVRRNTTKYPDFVPERKITTTEHTAPKKYKMLNRCLIENKKTATQIKNSDVATLPSCIGLLYTSDTLSPL